MRVHSTAPEGEGMEGPDGDGVEIKTNKLEIRGAETSKYGRMRNQKTGKNKSRQLCKIKETG